MPRVRLLPGGVLHVAALRLTLRPGWEGEVSDGVLQRYVGRFELLEPIPPPEARAVDVSEYHVGGGWYQVPGRDVKVRKAEALLLTGG